jgi:threonine aldolase
MAGVEMETPAPETNILFFRPTGELSAGELRERLRRRGILVTGNADRIRMLTHRDVDRAACERAVDEIHSALREG